MESYLLKFVVPLGLGGMVWMSCSFDGVGDRNRRACESYVAHMNTLQRCMNITYDADNLCTGVDAASVDMEPYYSCLQANATCKGSEPQLTLDGCTPPTVALGG